MVTQSFDFCIVGAGIIGLSVAYKLIQKYPECSLLILEKEDTIGQHQTSHNSGVIHSGIYYAPNSLKARLCKEGLIETKLFCDEHNIYYENCGKLIVATNSIEDERVKNLYERGKNNGANIKLLKKSELKDLEPNIEGNLAIFSPETGIVDYIRIANKLKDLISSRAKICLKEKIITIQEKTNLVSISTQGNCYQVKKLIACAGLQSDRIAKLAGLTLDCRIIPFRGEYFRLPTAKSKIIRHLIYPAPDPNLPFLGVHLTRMIDGSVTVGPNAVLGFSREGYEKFSFNLNDSFSFLKFQGFWKLIWKHRSNAYSELMGSIFKERYIKECKKYCPSLSVDDLLPYRAGIRAQVVSKDGLPYHDFLFKKTSKMLHVINAPSPAATAAFPIANLIINEATL